MLQPWYREVLEYALLTAYFLFLGLGPPAYLLWTWRRSGSRRRLAVHAALLPVLVFVLLGAIGGTGALIEVLRSPPTRIVFSRMGPWEYVAYTYWQWGAWSVWVAALLAPAWGAVALAWRRLRPASFRWVITPAWRRPLSFAEWDYADGVTAESADPGRRPADQSIEDGRPAPAVAAPPTDYLLWLVLGAAPIGLFVAVRLVLSGGSEFGEGMNLLPDWAVLIAGSAVVGWVLQEVAVRCGVRLSGRRQGLPDRGSL